MNSVVETPLNRFGIGEHHGVREDVTGAMERLCPRIGLEEEIAFKFKRSLLASLDECETSFGTSLLSAKVEPSPTSRKFWNLLGDIFVSKESKLFGEEHLRKAIEFMKDGGNIIVVQNHRSGADTLGFEAMIRRTIGFDVCKEWAYMSGHAVNLFLLPFIFTSAIRRFQIYSAKYRSIGIDGVTEKDMVTQNMRALRTMKQFMGTGGKLLAYYPEGGRGDGKMKRGEAKTSSIPRMASLSGRPLMILPTYVDGAENILPPVRTENEYNEVLEHTRVGAVGVHIGTPVRWETVQTTASRYEDQNQAICDILLSLVSLLGPKEERGCYGGAEYESMIAPIIRGES